MCMQDTGYSWAQEDLWTVKQNVQNLIRRQPSSVDDTWNWWFSCSSGAGLNIKACLLEASGGGIYLSHQTSHKQMSHSLCHSLLGYLVNQIHSEYWFDTSAFFNHHSSKSGRLDWPIRSRAKHSTEQSWELLTVQTFYLRRRQFKVQMHINTYSRE